MDKRSVIALVLIAIIILGGEIIKVRLFPPPPVVIDSIAGAPDAQAPGAILPESAAAHPAAPATGAKSTVAALPAPTPTVPVQRAETTTVSTTDRVAQFVNLGAIPVNIGLPGYTDLKKKTGTLTLTPTRGALMHFRVVTGADTIRFDNLAFTEVQSGSTIDFTSTTPAVHVKYDILPQHYLTHVTVTVPGATVASKLLVDLAPDLRSGEADTTDDIRHLAYAYRRVKGDVESVLLQKMDSNQEVLQTGPIDWVAIRNKYFVYAVIAGDSTKVFSDLRLRGGHHRPNGTPTGFATATMALPASGASLDLYTGPQSWQTLRDVGHELSNVNPYAGWSWLRPIVQPFSTIVMRLLLTFKKVLGLSYGWVLIIFGISIRMLLWPLNQGAMRTSMKMQKLQPELNALQKRYAKDPEGQRQAMVKLYQEHDMSPFSPLMGCLPMLIPMPILFALYFVFGNTIEFRGVHFLWLPDISLRDPYYITPIVMGLSMLVLSWIGMRSAPPNPQAKVMGYMMPAMFTMMFLNFASGLNLYYATQNLVAIPQQWLLTRERAKGGGPGVAAKAAPAIKPTR